MDIIDEQVRQRIDDGYKKDHLQNARYKRKVKALSLHFLCLLLPSIAALLTYADGFAFVDDLLLLRLEDRNDQRRKGEYKPL